MFLHFKNSLYSKKQTKKNVYLIKYAQSKQNIKIRIGLNGKELKCEKKMKYFIFTRIFNNENNRKMLIDRGSSVLKKS